MDLKFRALKLAEMEQPRHQFPDHGSRLGLHDDGNGYPNINPSA